MFGLVPPRMLPNVTTLGSRESTDRGSTWYRLVTSCAATAIGSTARWGRAACPPTPRITIRTSWQAAVKTPERWPIRPTLRSGSTCSATIERTSSTAPASTISTAPSLTSSAGWKIARQAIGEGSDSRLAPSASAAARAIVAWASWPQACITPSWQDRYGTLLASAIRKASISARKATRGRSPSPWGSAMRPRPVGAIRTGSPASESCLPGTPWSGILRGSARDGRAGAGAPRPSVRTAGRSGNRSPPATRSCSSPGADRLTVSSSILRHAGGILHRWARTRSNRVRADVPPSAPCRTTPAGHTGSTRSCT